MNLRYFYAQNVEEMHILIIKIADKKALNNLKMFSAFHHAA